MMKKTFAILFLAAAIIGSASGQAPASVAGFTYRGYLDGGIYSYQVASVDLQANGTYLCRVAVAFTFASPYANYSGAGFTGSYTYTVISPGRATLTLSGLGGPYTLNFSSDSEGTVGPLHLGDTYPFSFTPTGGNPAVRAQVNISTLLTVHQGEPNAVGFVIGGTKLREVLIRAVGPSLAQFGINHFAPNPVYTIHNRQGFYLYVMVGQTGGLMPGETFGTPGYGGGVGWSLDPTAAAARTGEGSAAGAFPLLQGSNDKADIFFLMPGAYTVVSNPSDASGEGTELIEVYEVE